MKMRKFTEFFMQRPTLFWSMVAVILIMGIYSFWVMPKLEDPAVVPKVAMVVAVYPGATAHDVELKVAKPIEDALKTLPSVFEIRTECSPGMALITTEFEMTVLNKDLQQHFDMLRRKVGDMSSTLPNGCYEPIVVDDMTDVYGILYGFYGAGYDYTELERYAKVVQRELMSVKGVKRINIVGARPEVINLIIDKERLAANGLIPMQLMIALNNAGKSVNAGKYADEDDMLSLQVSDDIRSEQDIADMLIKTADGKIVRVGDVVRIERTYSEPQRNGFFIGTEPALAICISMENNAIVPDVGRAVDKKLKEVLRTMPAGIQTHKVFFQPEQVSNAINAFMINLLESVLIVIIVLIFTYGLRSGLIIGGGLVLTIAMSFPILLALGSTLQRISLGAFIVAMGMLVDNSIVIMDGIIVDRGRGLSPKQYLVRIVDNTALPLLAATVVAVSTFIAVFLSPDSAGEYCRDMFMVLCVSLLASWVLALVQVPMSAKYFIPLRVQASEKKSQGVLNSPAHNFIRRSITKLISHKAVTLTLAFTILGISAAGIIFVKNLFFCDFDYRQFVIEYQLPSQTSPDRVRHDLLEISAMLEADEDVISVAASMGAAPAHYCLVRPMNNGGDSYGEVMVDCQDFKTVNKVIPRLKKTLREQYPDAYIRFRKYNFSVSTSHTIEAVFQGPDPAVLKDLSYKAEQIMRSSKYIDQYSVQNNWHSRSKNLVARFNQADAVRAGITRSDVADALKAATDGLPIGLMNDNDKMVIINLMVRNADGSQIQDITNIPVWSMSSANLAADDVQGLFTGATKPEQLADRLWRTTSLGNIAPDIDIEYQEDFVYRLNGQRTIEAEADPNTNIFHGTPKRAMRDIKKRIEAIPLPEGYTLTWAGDGKLEGMALENILGYVPLTLIIIIVILLLLFNNWKEVFSVLLCLPFVLCGIVPALLMFRQPFTFMAVLGMMGLMGMMVKNGIVLVDEINRLYKVERLDAFTADVEATVSRVRPVLLASLTTILGMAPLLGDPMYGSMAITIMSGLTVGTIITLILLPILYSAFFHVRK